MILTFCLLALLVSPNVEAQRIKGGRRLGQNPLGFRGISQPHVHVGKGGGGGGLHHTAVVADPVSQNPVIVEKISSLGSGAGLGPSSAQFTLADSQIQSFGQRHLYRAGQSQVPFGLSGLDYYSYPTSLLSRPRGIRGKSVFADNVSGLNPVGFGRKSAIIADPSTSQFTVGDAQIRTSPFGGRSLYRSGISSVPFGLSGLDYYSYPRQLLTQRRLFGGDLGQAKILSGGGFTAGDSQVSGLVAEPLGQEKVTIVESAPAVAAPAIVQTAPNTGFGQRHVTKSGGGLGGLRGGQIILRGGGIRGGYGRVKSRPALQPVAPVQDVQVLVDTTSGLGAPIGGFGQRQAAVTKSVAPAPIIQAPAPVISTPVRQFASRGLGEAFLTQAVRPRIAARRLVTAARPVRQYVQHRAPGNIQFTLGNTQIIGGSNVASRPIVSAPRTIVRRPTYSAPRPAVAFQSPVVSVQRPVVIPQRPVVTVQRQVVQQPEVISQVKTSGFGGNRIFGRRIPQMFYVDGGSRFPGIDIIGGYRIGDPRYNYAQLPISTQRFANLGLSQGSIDAGPILVAPAPAPAILNTKSAAKTAVSQASPLGFTAVGQTSPIQVVSQEEVIGPVGDTQVIPTVTGAGPSKIGGPVIGGALGLGGVGQTGTVTQGDFGLAGDSQVITTVSQSAPSKIGGPVVGSAGLTGIGQSAPSKIGGPVVGSVGLTGVGQSVPSKIGGPVAGPLGLTGVGQLASTQVVGQEIIGQVGDSQIVTTGTKSAPSKIGGSAVGGPLGITSIGKTSPANVISQEEAIGSAGDAQVFTTVSNSGPSKIGGPAVGGPLGLTGIGQTGSKNIVTQEEVIGPAGDSQIVTSVGGPSKIGGPAASSPLGLTAVGQSSPTRHVTQEEVIGPTGGSQIVTTITETASTPSKIGGAAASSPFAGVGQTETQVIAQEEIAGPSGGSQIIAAVSGTSPASNILQQEEVVGLSPVSSLSTSPLSQIAQDPIESAIGQSTFGDSGSISSGLSSLSQNIVDPIGSGQTQLSVDDVIGQSPISGASGAEFGQVEVINDGVTGGITSGIGEISQEQIGGGSLADPIVQQSISSGFDGGYGYTPRVTFLSQYPYDVPNRALLRQALTRPFVQQEQQQVEQFLV